MVHCCERAQSWLSSVDSALASISVPPLRRPQYWMLMASSLRSGTPVSQRLQNCRAKRSRIRWIGSRRSQPRPQRLEINSVKAGRSELLALDWRVNCQRWWYSATESYWGRQLPGVTLEPMPGRANYSTSSIVTCSIDGLECRSMVATWRPCFDFTGKTDEPLSEQSCQRKTFFATH